MQLASYSSYEFLRIDGEDDDDDAPIVLRNFQLSQEQKNMSAIIIINDNSKLTTTTRRVLINDSQANDCLCNMRAVSLAYVAVADCGSK